MEYTTVGLHLSPKGLFITPAVGEVHPEFQMLFHPNNQITHLEAISRALTIIRRHPVLSKQISSAQITFEKNDKVQTKISTLHNLEVYAWFNTMMKMNNPFDYLFRLVLGLLGGLVVVNIIKNHYTEDYDVDPGNSAQQIKKILPWAPPALRILTRLTALEDKLQAIGTERHRTGKRVAKRFEEQFPSAKPKPPADTATGKHAGGNNGGSNMVNPLDSAKANEKRKSSMGKV